MDNMPITDDMSAELKEFWGCFNQLSDAEKRKVVIVTMKRANEARLLEDAIQRTKIEEQKRRDSATQS